MDFDLASIGYTASIWILPVLIAITLHEAAHGWVAWKLGDDTAYQLGRVTFNPLKHIDPFGTILLPALLLLGSGGRMMLGFAKPVPVNFSRLFSPRRDMVLVALAGPVSNLLIALIATALLHAAVLLDGDIKEWIVLNLINALRINVLLFVFNMIPIPPLDGGRIAVGLLPAPLAARFARLEKFGFLILLAALFLLPYLGDTIGMDLNIFRWLVGIPTDYIMGLYLELFGFM